MNLRTINKVIGFVGLFLLVPVFSVFAENAVYTPIVGIPGLEGQQDFNGYINALYTLAISVASLIAVVKIVLAGAKYMLSGTIGDKSDAKEDIKNSLIGLLIIIGAVLILSTINSDLTNFKIFDEDDIITIRDEEPIREAMQATCDKFAGTADACGEVECKEEAFWNSIQPITNSGCYETTCEALCGVIGGVYNTDGENSCTNFSKKVVLSNLLTELDRIAKQNCPTGEECVGMACTKNDRSSSLTYSDDQFNSICSTSSRMIYNDYQEDCEAECTEERKGIYHPKSRGCILNKNQITPLTQEECSLYESSGWTWTTRGEKCFNQNEVLDRLCPEGGCSVLLCEEYGGDYGSCTQMACENQGGRYDSNSLSCLSTPVEDTTRNITVDPLVTYYMKQNDDEIAADDPRIQISIIGTQAVNGFVTVRFENGPNAGNQTELACNYFEPQVCN